MNTAKSITIILLGFLFVQLQAQNTTIEIEENEGSKKVVIIKKTIDADGNETVEKIVREGDDAEGVLFIDEDGKTMELDGKDIEWEGDHGEMLIRKGAQTITIDMDEEGVQKKMRIRTSEGGDEEEFNFNWDGDEMPEDVKKRLTEKGYKVQEDDGVMTITKGSDVQVKKMSINSNKAFLGVIMDTKKTVENVDGKETVTVEDSATIEDIVEGSAAEAAGLQKDDVITKIGAKNVENADGVTQALGDYKAGDKVMITYQRAGETMTTEATLKSSADYKNLILSDDDMEDIEIMIDSDDDGKKIKKKVIVIEKDEKKKKEKQ